jgi:secreted PhoX family phosphatase
MSISRRDLLRSGAVAAGAVAFGPAFLRDALAQGSPGPSPYGELLAPDGNGLMLPPGFTSRRIAVSGQPVGPSSYVLPIFPDGQATFKTYDGGWILVTNSESAAADGGGASGIRFAPDGTITSAYRILGGTARNCAGGPTPWGTWLSGEETASGLIWECDPAGKQAAQARAALGAFNHEAAAVDRVGKRVYLSEDQPDGGFYRFTPTTYPDLSAGTLEVAQVMGDSTVTWHVISDPTTTRTGTPTRQQVAQMTQFNGGEGLWYADGAVYFTTKGDVKVWSFTPSSQKMEVLYHAAAAPAASLDAVDNVTVGATGDLLVCEDGGNLEVGLITPERAVSPFLRLTGEAHATSELCGVVFSPKGDRMYVTSQRAAFTAGAPGAIYEISGPFRTPPGGVPADRVYGPPAGEPTAPAPGPDPAPPPVAIPDTRTPGLNVKAPRRVRRSSLLSKGIVVRVDVDEAADVAIVFDSRAIKRSRARRPVNVVLARARRQHPGTGTELKIRLRLTAGARKQLRRVDGTVRARILISARDAAGNESSAVKAVTIGRRAA